MSCKRYQKSIREAALGALGAAERAHLEAHLIACADCARAFDAERKLLAAIDEGLRQSADAQPSAEFAGKVRMRLAAERERGDSSPAHGRRIWAPIGALAAVAALVLAVWFGRRPSNPVPQRTRAAAPSSPPRKLLPGATEQAVTIRPGAPAAHGGRPAFAARRKRAKAAHRTHLEVMVEPGQWAAVMNLYDSLWAPAQSRNRAGGSRSGARSPGQRTASEAENPSAEQPIEIRPLRIAPLDPPGESQVEDVESPGR